MDDLSPLRAIRALSAPLVAFFLIQNLVGLAALALVGRIGDAALAGVGLGNVLYTLLLALLYGIDTGAQASISRAAGAGASALAGRMLTNALALGAPLGAVLALIAAFLGPGLVAAMIHDPVAAAAGAAFLRCAAPALLLQGITIPFNAYWIASGRPGVAFRVTAFIAPCQILLSVLLIAGGPMRGAAGAGLALTFAGLIGLAAQTLLAARWRPIPGLLGEAPDRARLAAIARIGWPISVQQSLSQVGLMVAYAIVARIGTAEVAVVNVLSNLMLLPIQIAVGMGVAAATLVGQALGRLDPAEARRWGWRTGALGGLVVLPLGLGVLVATGPTLRLFIADPTTVELALWPARLLAATVSLDAIGRILSFALRGAGATRAASLTPFVCQFLIQLPAMWWVGLVLGYGLRGLVVVQVGLSVLTWLVFTGIWRGGGWDRVRIAEAEGSALAG